MTDQILYRNKYEVLTNDGAHYVNMTIWADNERAAEKIALSMPSDYGRVIVYAHAKKVGD